MPIASLEYGKNGKVEKSAQRGYNIKTSVLVFLAEDGSDLPPFEFAPKTSLRCSKVGKEVTNNAFRRLWQLSAGKHVISLPSIRIRNKMPHPNIGWLSWNQAYLCTGSPM